MKSEESTTTISGHEGGRCLQMARLHCRVGDSDLSNGRECFINLNPNRGGPGPGPSSDGGAFFAGEREASAVAVRKVPVELVIKELVVRDSVTQPGETDEAAHHETWGDREENYKDARARARATDRDRDRPRMMERARVMARPPSCMRA